MPPVGMKIIVLGCSGSGKSTFSKKLHSVTGIPLIHLDNTIFLPGIRPVGKVRSD